MLSTKQKEWFKAMGIDPEKLVESVTSSKEVDFDLPDGSFYSDDKINELKLNVRKDHEVWLRETEGKKWNEEHELGLSTTDAKDRAKVLAALIAKGEKNGAKPSGEKVTELEKSLENLRKQLGEKDGEVKSWMDKYKEREIYDQYAALVPENANKFLTKDEHIARIRKAVEIGENGIAIDKATGNPFKDKMENARKISEVVSEMYKSNEGWLQPEATPEKKPFTHGTSKPGAKGGFDHDALVKTLDAKYDRTTIDGRRQYQAEYTAAMVNAQS